MAYPIGTHVSIMRNVHWSHELADQVVASGTVVGYTTFETQDENDDHKSTDRYYVIELDDEDKVATKNNLFVSHVVMPEDLLQRDRMQLDPVEQT